MIDLNAIGRKLVAIRARRRYGNGQLDAIEQRADVIVFIYRGDYCNKKFAGQGLAQIIIGKQRGGPTGSLKLKFFGEYARFDNLAHEAVDSFE